MTVDQLLDALACLPRDAEIGMLAASGCARPVVLQKIIPDAGWRNGQHATMGGFKNPRNAYLLRPAQDVI